jgi:hypothetical protein
LQFEKFVRRFRYIASRNSEAAVSLSQNKTKGTLIVNREM